MADVFNINWVERMKTDPRANSILNNKTDMEEFYTFYFFRRGGIRRMREGRTFKRRLNQLYSDRYTKDRRTFRPRPTQPGRYRYDLRFHPHRIYNDNNPNKYWENVIGNHLYKKDSIANAPNPHIEKLAYNE